MAKISKEEYEILKSLGDEWKWIARDKNGYVYIHDSKPHKFHLPFCGGWEGDSWMDINGDFSFIQWEDESPYNIQDLVDEYEREYHIENAKIVNIDASKLTPWTPNPLDFESEETEVKDIEFEIWKDITGYEGIYQVSNLGRVRSLDRFVPRKTGTVQKVHGRVLKPQKDKDGYLQVGLWKENKVEKAKVHRIVAKAFVPNLNDLPEINHINEVKDDNRVGNLEWCTRKENINHGTRSEQVAKTKRKPVIGINVDTGKKTTFKSLREASKFGFHTSAIRKVCMGEQEAHKGYSWAFVKEGEKV